MNIDQLKTMSLIVEAYSERAFRISFFPKNGRRGSALNKYGVINENQSTARAQETDHGLLIENQAYRLNVVKDNNIVLELSDDGGETLLSGEFNFFENKGFFANFAVSAAERFYGLGDVNRECVNRRGHSFDLWVKNVLSYIPMPFMISSNGYGIFCNSTHRQRWDVAKSQEDRWSVVCDDDQIDFYIFAGQTPKEILAEYLRVTGPPCLPPKWSFGYWLECRYLADENEIMEHARLFRELKIPCDVLGLEPGWMETIYDYSTEKKWCHDRFPWGVQKIFIDRLKKMGYHLELWLCCDYDLSWEAERKIKQEKKSLSTTDEAIFEEDDMIQDERLIRPVLLDKITKPEEAWFDHLKKFLDQGVSFFKMDAADQTREHPDRVYRGNGMTDKEMHNLYPMLLTKQMYDGHKEHDGKRPCVFNPNGYAGLQKYAGSWAGDTGGGPKTLVACVNLAMTGHGLVTCDMETETATQIHYAFLLPWCQQNNFMYWNQPWMLEEPLKQCFIEYARFRSRLIPYLYTSSYVAHTERVPMFRPLLLEFPDDAKCAEITTQYFLGDLVMVSAFTEDVYLPDGRWLDLWTGESSEGGRTISYVPPENKGGGLFLRENSILPLGPVKQHVGEATKEGFDVIVFMNDDANAEFTIFDDDGESFAYLNGEFESHTILATFEKRRFAVESPKTLKVDRINAYLSSKPEKVAINGKDVKFDWNDHLNHLTIEREV